MKHTPGFLRKLAAAGLAVSATALCLLGLLGCSSSVTVDDSSPRVESVSVSAQSSMTESSQEARIDIHFTKELKEAGSILDDLRFTLNGSEPDQSVVSVTAAVKGSCLSVSLTPGPDAAQGGQGTKSALFALYQGQFELAPSRSDGALTSLRGESGSCAVIDEPLQGLFASGLTIAEKDSVAGSKSTRASQTVEVTAPAQIRAVTWFTVDGGKNVLLKHNHTFATISAADAAADMANVINEADLDVRATSKGNSLAVTAKEPKDKQRISLELIEGLGAKPGAFSSN